MKLSIAYMDEVHSYPEPHAELFYEEDGKETVESEPLCVRYFSKRN